MRVIYPDYREYGHFSLLLTGCDEYLYLGMCRPRSVPPDGSLSRQRIISSLRSVGVAVQLFSDGCVLINHQINSNQTAINHLRQSRYFSARSLLSRATHTIIILDDGSQYSNRPSLHRCDWLHCCEGRLLSLLHVVVSCPSPLPFSNMIPSSLRF